MRKYNFSGKNSAQSSAVAPLYITKQQKEQNVGGFLGGIGYLGEKLATGFFQSLEGISDYTFGGFAKLFGADDWAEEQFENDWFGDWYTHPDEWYNPSEGWKVAGDVAGGGHGGADKRMFADFITCIVEGKKPTLDVDFAINMSLPGVLAHESAIRGGMPMEIPQF